MATNGSGYRGAYLETHAARLAQDWEYATQELGLEYTESVKLLDGQLEAERAYLEKLMDLREAQAKAKKTGKPEDNAALDKLLSEIVNLEVAEGQRRSEDADRRVELVKEYQNNWEAPPSSVSQLNILAGQLKGTAASFTTPEELASSIKGQLADSRFAGVTAALATPQQKRDAGIKLKEAILSSQPGMDDTLASKAVAQALGLSEADLDRTSFEFEKETSAKDFEKKAYAGSKTGMVDTDGDGVLDTPFKEYLQSTFVARTQGLGGPKKASPETQRNVDKYLESEGFKKVQKALEDGTLTDGELTPEELSEYEATRRTIQRENVNVGESDGKFFDDDFLEIAASRYKIGKLEEERGALKVPTVEDIRERTADIYRPHSSKRFAKTYDAARKYDESKMTDQQRATYNMGKAAVKMVRENKDWQKEDSKLMRGAKSIKGMLDSGSLKPSDVWKQVSSMAEGDEETRNEIYKRVLAFSAAEKANSRFAPPEEPAPAPPPKTSTYPYKEAVSPPLSSGVTKDDELLKTEVDTEVIGNASKQTKEATTKAVSDLAAAAQAGDATAKKKLRQLYDALLLADETNRKSDYSGI